MNRLYRILFIRRVKPGSNNYDIVFKRKNHIHSDKKRVARFLRKSRKSLKLRNQKIFCSRSSKVHDLNKI